MSVRQPFSNIETKFWSDRIRRIRASCARLSENPVWRAIALPRLPGRAPTAPSHGFVRGQTCVRLSGPCFRLTSFCGISRKAELNTAWASVDHRSYALVPAPLFNHLVGDIIDGPVAATPLPKSRIRRL